MAVMDTATSGKRSVDCVLAVRKPIHDLKQIVRTVVSNLQTFSDSPKPADAA
jgi:hypothetical protein